MAASAISDAISLHGSSQQANQSGTNQAGEPSESHRGNHAGLHDKAHSLETHEKGEYCKQKAAVGPCAVMACGLTLKALIGYAWA
jgi:hypothetical protein